MPDATDAQPGGALIAQRGWGDEIVGTGDVRLHVVEAGDGPPVILLHGFRLVGDVPLFDGCGAVLDDQ